MVENWGQDSAGEAIYRVCLERGGLSARVITYGATLQDLRLDGHPHPLVLGFNSLAGYQATEFYIGSAIGRYTNRIGGAAFVIDGDLYRVDANEAGNCLHGGAGGFHRRHWTIDAAGDSFVSLSYVSKAGEMGFPGALHAQCRYRLLEDQTLEIVFRAVTDAPTVCSMTNHSYFNLDDGGAKPINKHRLRIAAAQTLVTDELDIATGDIIAVDSTEQDFRSLRNFGSAAYDLNYCVSDRREMLRHVATVEGDIGLCMDLATTEPGLQFYTGDHLFGLTAGLDDIVYGGRSGLCLEPQNWPNAPNHAHFPSPVLRPGETLEQKTTYRFYQSDS